MATATVEQVMTANDELKAKFPPLFWRGITAAAVLHFALFAFGPRMMIADIGVDGREIRGIEIPDRIDIPPPPPDLPRPAVPIISTDVNVDPDQTIASVIFDDNPPASLPEPPRGTVNTSDDGKFTPYEVRPEFRNPDEYLRALQRQYPPLLRDSGVGGMVVLWVYIDEAGVVRETQVVTSSGRPELDSVAERVMREVARFTPALNRDQRVPVWVRIPVTFTTR